MALKSKTKLQLEHTVFVVETQLFGTKGWTACGGLCNHSSYWSLHRFCLGRIVGWNLEI